MKNQILLTVLIMSGCSSYNLDQNKTFGIATKQIIDLQIADKTREHLNQGKSNTDGQSMKSAIDRYQRSFENSISTNSTPLNSNSTNSTMGSRQ
jgi:hypothetical protein